MNCLFTRKLMLKIRSWHPFQNIVRYQLPEIKKLSYQAVSINPKKKGWKKMVRAINQQWINFQQKPKSSNMEKLERNLCQSQSKMQIPDQNWALWKNPGTRDQKFNIKHLNKAIMVSQKFRLSLLILMMLVMHL